MKKQSDLRVRIDKNQKDEILAFCEKAQINQSEFIRNLIAQRDLKEIKIFSSKEREAFEEMNFSLQKIGTNINQIAHFLNLEHLKGFADFKTIQDILTIDKLKESQINSLKISIKELSDQMIKLQNKLSEAYARKT